MLSELCHSRPAKGLRALSQTVSGRRADGARAADDHVFDGASRFREITSGDDPELMRQQALLDQHDRVLLGVESDGAIVARSASDSDVHSFVMQRTEASVSSITRNKTAEKRQTTS